MRQSGLEISPAQSPYKPFNRKKGGTGAKGLEEDADFFTAADIRHVVRYIEDSMTEVGEDGNGVLGGASNGLIDFTELDCAFRRANRSRAAAKYEAGGKAAVKRLMEFMAIRKQTPTQWFDMVDRGVHKDGYLTHEELVRGLTRLKDPKVRLRWEEPAPVPRPMCTLNALAVSTGVCLQAPRAAGSQGP
jgi:hypothetical protein